MMNDINTRKIDFFEAFAMSMAVFKANYKKFFSISLIIGIPVSIIITFAGEIITKMAESANILGISPDDPRMLEYIQSGEVIPLLAVYGLAIVVQSLFMPLVTTAVADGTKDALCGINSDAKRSIGKTMANGNTILIASFINVVLTTIGTVFFVIPGLLISVWLYFYSYAIIFDAEGIIGSLKKSRWVVKGNFWYMAMCILAVNFMSSTVSELVYMFLGVIAGNFVGSVIIQTLITFLQTFFVCVMSIIYLNKKAMKIKAESQEFFN